MLSRFNGFMVSPSAIAVSEGGYCYVNAVQERTIDSDVPYWPRVIDLTGLLSGSGRSLI